MKKLIMTKYNVRQPPLHKILSINTSIELSKRGMKPQMGPLN